MPFIMPVISSISSAVSEEFIVRMMGIPPPTDASNRKLMFAFFAISISSAPYLATKALFDVATCFPFSRAAFTKV